MKPVYDLYFSLLPVRKINTDNQFFLLNESEIKAIRKKEKTAVWLSAVIGALELLFYMFSVIVFRIGFVIYLFLFKISAEFFKWQGN